MTRGGRILGSALAAVLVAAVAWAGGDGSPASAQEPPPEDAPAPPTIEVSLEPVAHPQARHPMRRALRLAVGEIAPGATWVADRRLLRFELRPGRGGRARCRHPDAPRSARDARRLPATETAVEELVDLRMYCTGRARRLLDAADEGDLEVRASYGFPRRGRHRWLVSAPDGSPPDRRERVHAVDGPRWTWSPPAPSAAEPAAPAAADAAGGTVETRGGPAGAPGAAATPEDTSAAASEPAGPSDEVPPNPDAALLDVRLRDRDVNRPGGLVFPVSLRAEVPRRVYLRDDMLAFEVRGPYGTTTCQIPERPITPIVDFFHRLGGRRTARTTVAADRYCDLDEAFPLAGVYDVRPVVELRFDGAEYGYDAFVGRFVGEPAEVRIRREPGGYVPHPVPVMGADEGEGAEPATAGDPPDGATGDGAEVTPGRPMSPTGDGAEVTPGRPAAPPAVTPGRPAAGASPP